MTVMKYCKTIGTDGKVRMKRMPVTERLAFFIDVGSLSDVQAKHYLNNLKMAIKRRNDNGR